MPRDAVLGGAVPHPGNAKRMQSRIFIPLSDGFFMCFPLIHSIFWQIRLFLCTSKDCLTRLTRCLVALSTILAMPMSTDKSSSIQHLLSANIFVHPTSTKACTFYSTRFKKQKATTNLWILSTVLIKKIEQVVLGCNHLSTSPDLSCCEFLQNSHKNCCLTRRVACWCILAMPKPKQSVEFVIVKEVRKEKYLPGRTNTPACCYQ